MDRLDASFVSGGDGCAAWIHRPRGGAAPAPCAVMANGFTLTRHDGLPRCAERFAAAGLAVVLFDHRLLGGSADEPRQLARFSSQRVDWRAAIAFARGLDGMDPERVVACGYSFAGGTVTRLAAEDDRLAVAQRGRRGGITDRGRPGRVPTAPWARGRSDRAGRRVTGMRR